MNGFNTGSGFNRFTNLDNIEWNIINYLINDKSQYAENLWKILKYDTPDCLQKDNLTTAEKFNLVYTGAGDSTKYRVFMAPFTDDAWTQESSHLHIYIQSITPTNHLTSKVNVAFETIVHNKLTNILGQAQMGLLNTNPTEQNSENYNLSTDEEGMPWSFISFKNRESVMLKNTLAALNGREINGVGVLQFNADLSPYDVSKLYLWNGRNFYGHSTIMTSIMSGISDDSECGY